MGTKMTGGGADTTAGISSGISSGTSSGTTSGVAAAAAAAACHKERNTSGAPHNVARGNVAHGHFCSMPGVASSTLVR